MSFSWWPLIFGQKVSLSWRDHNQKHLPVTCLPSNGNSSSYFLVLNVFFLSPYSTKKNHVFIRFKTAGRLKEILSHSNIESVTHQDAIDSFTRSSLQKMARQYILTESLKWKSNLFVDQINLDVN